MAKEKIKKVFVDLVLDSGELVRIECPEQFEDELHQTLESTMKRRDWWAPGQWDHCRAEFMGMNLDRVAMSRVVGML